jgi:hypothetical protein
VDLNYALLNILSDLAGSVATIGIGLFVIIKLVPQIGVLINTIGEWRGEVNTKLDTLDVHTRASAERNTEDHGKIYASLGEQGQRIARLEGHEEK